MKELSENYMPDDYKSQKGAYRFMQRFSAFIRKTYQGFQIRT